MVQDSILIAGEDDVVVALVMTQDHELDVTLDGEQQANAAVIGCADRMLDALEDINRHGIGSGFFQGTPRLMALINEARGAKV